MSGAPAKHAGGAHGGGPTDAVSSRHVPGSDAVPDWVVHHEREGEVSEGGKRELRAPFVRGPVEGGSNCWTETDATKFNLRGPTYLTDSVKLPSKEPTHRPIGVNAFKTKAQLWHAVEVLPELREFLAAHGDQQFVVITWLLPGTPAHTVVQLFVRRAGPDRIFDTLFQRFCDGDDTFRNSRFKFMCKVVHAPWLVTAAVSNLGGERPAILGKKLTTRYFKGANYLEICVDVGSSKIASMVNGVILKGASSVITDLAFLLEGQELDELPERMLGCLRFHSCDIANLAIDRTATL